MHYIFHRLCKQKDNISETITAVTFCITVEHLSFALIIHLLEILHERMIGFTHLSDH